MTSGPSGKHTTERRKVGSEHWRNFDRAAMKLGTGTGTILARQLIDATITDTDEAIAICRRIQLALKRRSET